MLTRLSLRQKLLLVLSLPLAVICFLLLLYSSKLNESVVQAKHTQALVGAISALDQVAHNLALERGLTAGFIGSGGAAGKDKLVAQRQTVDAKLDALSIVGQQDSSLVIYSALAAQIQEQAAQLTNIRQRVDALDANNGAFAFISQLNGQALAAIAALMVEVPDNQSKQTLLAIYELLNVKEQAGQERGKLNFVFAQGKGSPNLFAEIRGYIADQTLHQNTFQSVAPPELASRLNDGMNAPELAEFYEFRDSFLRQSAQRERIIGIEAPHWFELATTRIKAVKGMAEIGRAHV